MSTASSRHRPTGSRRIDALSRNGGGSRAGDTHTRDGSRASATAAAAAAARQRGPPPREVYLHSLSIAFLHYLLQPRQKRREHVPAPAAQAVNRASGATSIMGDVMKEFGALGTSKSSRLPKDFMKKLIDRMRKVVMRGEQRQEYQDDSVRRSFGAALNYFLEEGFQKRMEKDRKPDDLVLMFYSRATSELQRGHPAGDDSWKLMVDRHVALFVRFMSLIMKDNDWSRERPELASRLNTLETKMLAHDQDLSATQTNGTFVEVTVPLSYQINDMPMVQAVGRIFGISPIDLQEDIDEHKNVWTLKEAMNDIKTYQTLLNLNSKQTLTSDDFDLESAYEAWKRSEAPEISQLLYAIFQIDPDLARNSSARHRNSTGSDASLQLSGIRKVASDEDPTLPFSYDQAVDSITSPVDTDSDLFGIENHPFTFIPPDKRAYFRHVLSQTLTFEMREHNLNPPDAAHDLPRMFSKPTIEFLDELCKVWRIPYVSRVLLFVDLVREKYGDGTVNIDILDQTLSYLRGGIPDLHHKEQNQSHAKQLLAERQNWTLADFALIQQILASVHESLLRDIYAAAQQCFDNKSPKDLGPLMFLLDTYVYDDPNYSKGSKDLHSFTEQLTDGLKDKASSVYRDLFAKNVPKDHDTWEFYHVIQLGKVVTGFAQKIQKRYKKNPDILGVSPLSILADVIFPEFAMDARDMTAHILKLADYRGQTVPIEDGFDLYRELVDIRTLHNEALPGVDFGFQIEDQLAQFVWRWIALTEESMPGWVENAVKQDNFGVRSQPGDIPTDEERHSVSISDIFTSFDEAIERVVNLNWDNDLHYAKFMTAVAKVIGQGIARYCELVEQRFSREMDRLTPEQMVEANRTRQEKWLNAAKEAWSNREKVEPFQFFPESFVKLNNIEYGTRQLDRLEREVNVDACVAVIEENTPPVTLRQQRRATTYVFTIKIVEAEDLKACDINGLSDPYVVLGDEYQKRLAKTRIIYGNLNPRWDESVDITTQGPLNVVATVWDWDAVGDHDCVGRTSIKLDPAHFSDFMPREYWLDLDTQGRLLLRVSMEGERDDIQFYFGKAFRTLRRTERDMTRIITDKLSSYISYCLSQRALRSLLGRGINLSTVTSYFNRNKPAPTTAAPTDAEIAEALKSLFTYFDDNFAIMNQTLTDGAMMMVMTRLWKEVLVTLEALVVPPLSDKPSTQRPLSQQELDVVYKWLQLLYDFFHAVDEETGEANGVPLDVLRSPKYFDITMLAFFYFEPTATLIHESERMASATAASQQAAAAAAMNARKASVAVGPGSSAGDAAALQALLGAGGGRSRKTKSVMLSRNLGTIKKAKEEKRKEAQADPNDDMILRILRMRPDSERYLRERSRQKERLAAAAAAELIVKQSLAAGGGGGRMTGPGPGVPLPRR